MHASRISSSKLYILFHSLLWAVSVERRRGRQCASAAKRAEAATCCPRIATVINMVMLLLHLEIQITFPVPSGAVGCQACKGFDKTVANGAVVKRSLTALPAKLTSSKTGGWCLWSIKCRGLFGARYYGSSWLRVSGAEYLWHESWLLFVVLTATCLSLHNATWKSKTRVFLS